MTSPLALAAADYLNRGLSVIALTGKMPNGKVHRHGLHEPIVGPVETPEDWALLESVFDRDDTTGVGILTTSPLVVVDLDSEAGAQNWLDLVGPDDFLPATWVARTGKGAHLYFAVPFDTGTFKLFGTDGGVDLKGTGGYVAAPPSAHPDGGRYEWVSEPGQFLVEAPLPLQNLIQKHLDAAEARAVTKRQRKAFKGKTYEDGDTVFFAQRTSIEPLIKGMRDAEEGNRNHYLHWAAATMAEDGASDEEFDDLAEAALAAGLEPVEVRRTIDSGRRTAGG